MTKRRRRSGAALPEPGLNGGGPGFVRCGVTKRRGASSCPLTLRAWAQRRGAWVRAVWSDEAWGESCVPGLCVVAWGESCVPGLCVPGPTAGGLLVSFDPASVGPTAGGLLVSFDPASVGSTAGGLGSCGVE